MEKCSKCSQERDKLTFYLGQILCAGCKQEEEWAFRTRPPVEVPQPPPKEVKKASRSPMPPARFDGLFDGLEDAP